MQLPDLAEGFVFAHNFVVDEVLTRGALGTLYLVHERGTETARTLKLYRAAASSNRLSMARTNAGWAEPTPVRSPHVLHPLATDTDGATGAPFALWEHLDGEALPAMLERRGALSPRAAALMLAQICDGLGAVHRAGLAHGALGTDSVFVARATEGEAPFIIKLLDLGVASVLPQLEDASPREGYEATPWHLAPEQIHGAVPCTAAADVWALGLLAFEMLTGRGYWLAANVKGASISAFLAELRDSALVPPSRRLEGLGAPVELPDGFDHWFLRCVRREPGERYAHARAAWAALRPLFEPQEAGEEDSGPPSSGSDARSEAARTLVSDRAREDVLEAGETADAGPRGGGGRRQLGPGGTVLQGPVDLALSYGASPVRIGDAGASDDPPTHIPQAPPPKGARRARRSPSARIAVGVLAAASLLAGGLLTAQWLRPATIYCVGAGERFGAPTCIGEISAELAAKRSRSIRLTRERGRITRLENVNGHGLRVPDAEGVANVQVQRRTDGTVESKTASDRHLRPLYTLRFAPDGKRVQVVGRGDQPRPAVPGARYTHIDRELDGDGRVVKERYFLSGDIPAPDAHGAFGYLSKFDGLGREVETTVLGPDGSPAFDGEWTQRASIVRDARGDVVLLTFTSVEGTPTVAKSGCSGFRTDRDTNGNEVGWMCLGPDRKPAPLRGGHSGWTTRVDAHGEAIERRYVAADGSPARDEKGVAGWKRTLNGHGEIVEARYIAPDGAPTPSVAGVAGEARQLDGSSEVTVVSFLGIDGKPARGKEGYATVRYERDASHRVSQTAYFDESGQPAFGREGFAAVKTEHDDDDHVLARAYFGRDGKPGLHAKGHHRVAYTYDAHDRVTEERFSDRAGNPVRSTDWYAVERTRYDERGNDVETSYFDTNLKPTRSRDGWASSKALYSDRGVLIQWRAFNAEGKPTWTARGCAGTEVKTDGLGREVEHTCQDLEGRPTPDDEGFVTRRTEFDARGNAARVSYFDAFGRPTESRSLGCAQIRTAHDPAGRAVEIAFLDVLGKPTTAKAGYAMERRQYDERGLLSATTYLDIYGKPAPNTDGVTTERRGYDAAGRTTEWSYFDSRGNPTRHRGGYGLVRSGYDSRGNQAEWAYFDEQGRASAQDGCAISRARYDDKDRKIETTYHDGSGGPCLEASERVATKRFVVDDRGNVLEERFLGGDGAATTGKSGYAAVKRVFDERDLRTEQTLVDTEGKPAKGFLVERARHDDRGHVVEKGLFDEAGAHATSSQGVSTTRTRYDERGRAVEIAWLDASGQPAKHKGYGGVAARISYDVWGTKREEAVVDGAGKVVRTMRWGPDGARVK